MSPWCRELTLKQQNVDSGFGIFTDRNFAGGIDFGTPSTLNQVGEGGPLLPTMSLQGVGYAAELDSSSAIGEFGQALTMFPNQTAVGLKNATPIPSMPEANSHRQVLQRRLLPKDTGISLAGAAQKRDLSQLGEGFIAQGCTPVSKRARKSDSSQQKTYPGVPENLCSSFRLSSFPTQFQSGPITGNGSGGAARGSRRPCFRCEVQHLKVRKTFCVYLPYLATREKHLTHDLSVRGLAYLLKLQAVPRDGKQEGL